MFGFQVKKEYVFDKIKQYLNITEEIDYENPPELFKQILNNYFSIECLNNKNIHLIIHELKNKVNELNPEADNKKLINLVCSPSGELYIGSVIKDELQITESFGTTYDRSQYFDETVIQNSLDELKEFIGIHNIQDHTKHIEIKIKFDYEKYGSSFIQEFAEPNERISRKEELLKIMDEHDSLISDDIIKYI